MLIPFITYGYDLLFRDSKICFFLELSLHKLERTELPSPAPAKICPPPPPP